MEVQVRENAELAERLRLFEEAVKGCLPDGYFAANEAGNAGLVNGLQ